MPDVIAKVISQKGTCGAGHTKIGEEFVIGDKTPSNMCSYAFCTLFPFVTVLKFGGTFPLEKDPNKCIIACPDPANPVVFELSKAEDES